MTQVIPPYAQVALRDAIPDDDRIASVRVMHVGAALPQPVVFANWVMREREFALVRIETESGLFGHAFTLTRDGPIDAIVRRTIAPHYVGRTYRWPEEPFYAAQLASLSIHVSGAGLRALSIVDLAMWDLAARAVGVPVAQLLAGEPVDTRLPVTAIIGYPPTMDGAGVHEQVSGLYADGWRRFKLPVAATPELTRERFHAAREAGGDSTVAMDAAWVFRTVEDAAELCDSLPGLHWFEDVFPPGDAAVVRALRDRVDVPIAMGDEQGGAYFPEALLALDAVDIVRLDATCMGGLTRLRPMVDQVERAGVRMAPHMFAHVHSQILAGIGRVEPVEWGVPGTGVDQYADSLAQPVVRDGLMEPLHQGPGFGDLVNPAWVAEQRVDDPDGILKDLG
jgi:L-alanine-DL-glutamate epimerase-like enolase superfamily enzyme